MKAVPTNHLRDAVADAVESLLSGATLRVGNGRYQNGAPVKPQPSHTNLGNPILSGIPVTVVRTGNSFVLHATVAGTSTPLTITEAGVFLQNGQAVILESFHPRTIEAPMTHTFKYTIFPGGN
ncbi:hypothetical protein [Deinococcus cellulosilyticus]|uniref:Uncharacterized protein n=1 Tax=Deinococcus cellulosilyticus (strain DSM 18568 / NBRC 106333 / KACC 11606 / 5516J-15) TaxID=1223518 RepID=A0A511N835_DEIC1|nr:hypothetical protein [Deinococcus cellulosilyticus]GEM48667.1 hypothetical protein DC3_43020 [Deinococcus cellulosilyticus NBRC 106333 = KACC 11606]